MDVISIGVAIDANIRALAAGAGLQASANAFKGFDHPGLRADIERDAGRSLHHPLP